MRGPKRSPMTGLVRGAVTLMLSTVAGSALGVVFWMVGARVYGAEELGKASAGFSAITLLGGLAALSLGTVLVRFLPTSGRHAGRMVRYAQLASASLGIVVAGVTWFSGLARSFLPEGRWPFLFFCTAVACAALLSVHDGALTGLGAPSWVAARTVTVAMGRLAMVVALAGTAAAAPLLLGWGLPLIAVSLVTAVALVVATAWRPMPGREVVPTSREAASFATSQYLIVVVGSLGQFAPPVLVTMVLGAEVNGAAFHIPWLIAGVASALGWNSVVSFVVVATREPEGMRSHVRHVLLLLGAVMVVGAAAVAAASPLLLGFLGQQYRQSSMVPLLVILLALPFLTVRFLYAAVAMIDKRMWPVFSAEAVLACVFLGGAFWGLHEFGVLGAVGAFLAAEALIAVALLPATVRRFRLLVAGAGLAAAPARGVARVPVRAVPEVAAVGPGSEGAPMTIVFFPDIDGSLKEAQTAVLRRIRNEPDSTVQFGRVATPAADAMTQRLAPVELDSEEQPGGSR